MPYFQALPTALEWTAMKQIAIGSWSLAALLTLLLLPAPADAQNLRGADRARGADRYEDVFDERDDEQRRNGRADRDRSDDDWYDDIGRNERSGNGAGKVPPGWCKGRGNPHNTVENCGYNARNDRDVRYDDRYSRDGGYDRAHDDFHRRLDGQYRDRARSRPTDLEYQLRLRRQMNEEHDRWHRNQGIAHR